MKRTMYDITVELDNARDQAYTIAEENEGVLPDYVSEFLDNLEGEREDKAVNIACAYKDLNSFVDDIATEQKRLKKLKAQYVNEAERVKTYLSMFIDNGEKIKDPRASISWRKSTSLLVDENLDPKTLPEEYQKIKVEVNKTELTKAIKAGDDDAMKLGELVTKSNIQIK